MKTKTIESATVVYSVNLVDIKVPKNATAEEQQKTLRSKADEYFNAGIVNKAIIHECSDDGLIE